MRHVLWLWLVPLVAVAQPAFRVRDLRQVQDTAAADSHPTEVTAFKNGVVFAPLRSLEREPWWSDGTAAGTVQLVDAHLGPGSSDPHEFTPMGDRLFFVAQVSYSYADQALFVTDGTPGGTRQVRRLRAARNLTVVGSTLFFSAGDGKTASGFSLWKSDGTSEGTVPVAPLPSSSSGVLNAWSFTAVGSTLFFGADQSATGSELWKSDGTAEGTVMVRDISPGAESSDPADFAAVGSTLFFAASDGVNGRELWKSDGTRDGTVLVANISPASEHSTPFGLTAVGSTLVFFAHNGANGYEPWRSDGTPEGTVMVADLATGSSSSVDKNNPRYDVRTVVGSTLYFVASGTSTGLALWKTDGTAAGTVPIRNAAGNRFIPYDIAAVGSTVFFTSGTGATHSEKVLWKTDGTAAGTLLVSALPAITGEIGWGQFASSGGRLFFAASSSAAGLELWTSDGTSAGTVSVKDIHPRNSSSSPEVGVALGNVLLFAAEDGTLGKELWKTDGTEAGTVLVKDLRPGSSSSNPTSFTRLGSVVYFAANDGTSGEELWKTDGTEAGTTRVTDLPPGQGRSLFTWLTAWGESLYFLANIAGSGDELWKTDGTEAGTVRLKDIRTGGVSGSSSTAKPVVANGLLFFEANDGASGWELWKSDGTPAGTALVRDMRPGSEGLSYNGSSRLARVGSNVFYSVHYLSSPEDERCELWRSDGTSDGSIQLGTFSCDSAIDSMVEFRGHLYFVAEGHQLWRSDGTPPGTSMVGDWNPGAPSARYSGGLLPVGSTLFFAADDGVHGAELWKTDGTWEGTARLTDLAPGPMASVVGPLIASQRLLWFAGSDGTSGLELWQSDGTVQGTRRVHDIAAGATSSSPGPVVGAGGKLFFAASDADGDRELWAHSVDPTPPRIVPEVVGTLGEGGWYTSDVSVSFHVEDDESPLGEASGCGPFVLTFDSAGRTVTCTASSWGGSATQSVLLKRDATPPTLNCPDPVQLEATGPDGAAALPAPVAQDAMDAAPMVTTSVSPGTAVGLGTTQVSASARDAAGNVSTCTFQVAVRDTVAPGLSCPAAVETESTRPEFSAVATDLVDASPALEYSHASGSEFSVGETRVTVTATDDSGNRASCTFPVRVRGEDDEEEDEDEEEGQGGGESGCGCASTADVPLAAYALMLWVALAAVRRRARS
ncbi:ELWxxDGT repeat protein [Pyxidicoccus trucidator]|uniref:ELWxxDGT repeat protein n=1 Tax=Pyxidicoccus trucidator TaxID=2709662 RepID=UPI0013DD336D|nr:ELWxxDGT repeat protein [Pyxidicoccus trucidator]